MPWGNMEVWSALKTGSSADKHKQASGGSLVVGDETEEVDNCAAKLRAKGSWKDGGYEGVARSKQACIEWMEATVLLTI
jgi:hypothetical protein